MADFFTPSRGSYDPSFANESDGNSLAGLAFPSAAPAGPTVAPVGFDETTRQVFVNGRTFNADDHASALESVADLDKPLQPMPSNFRPMSPSEYGGYINRIKDPTLGRLASKNFGIGVDVSQQLAGGALKFLGAEETGQAIIDQQEEDIRFNQPYQRNFTDIDSAGGVGDWFVANAAQMAPLMAEMIITSALTGGAGGVAAGTARGARFLAKGATKKASRELKSGPTRTAAIKQAEANAAIRARDALVQGLKPDVEDMKALRKAGRIGGAKLGAVAAAEGVAIGDIYQAVEESGNYDSPTLARLVTAVASVPYAAAEVLPAFLAAKTVFGKAGRSALTKGGRAKRGAIGFGVGGGLEGSTEAFQEIVSLGAAGELDFNDPEVRNRLINAFAAGAGVGAPIGTLSNIVRATPKAEDSDTTPPVDTEKEDANILDPKKDFMENLDPDSGLVEPGRISPQALGLINPQQTEMNLEGGLNPAQGELDLLGGQTPSVNTDLREIVSFSEPDPNQLSMELPLPAPPSDGPLFDYVGSPEQQAAQQAAQQRQQEQAAQLDTAPPVYVSEPTTNPAIANAMDLARQQEAMRFGQNAIALQQAAQQAEINPLQAESNAIQNQQFSQMQAALEDQQQAALADQQQSDIRLQEQLPLPTPRQPLRRSPLLKASDEPTLLVERVVDGRSVVEPVPVEEVYQQSATEMQAIMRLQRCLQKSL